MSQHHARQTLVVDEVVDQWGQLHAIKGRGFSHVSIWDEFKARKNAPKFRKIWIESPGRKVVFEAKKGHTYEQVVAFRDEAFPGYTVCAWEGEEGEGVFSAVDRPKTPPAETRQEALI